MKGYIYKYTFPDGKVYIGQTRRPIEIRHSEHLNPSTGPLNPGFWEAYQKLGMPVLTVLETVEDDDQTRLIQLLHVWKIHTYTESTPLTLLLAIIRSPSRPHIVRTSIS